ncbi:MAG: S8 family serine peptidase [Hyphomonadaceae bacterium]|nr:S8 family serine peptidase [Clostridia bacterium]
MLFQTRLSDYTVTQIKQDQRKEIIDYGVKMVGAPLEWPETMGKGIKVGIIDTGIDAKHEDLRGCVREAINFSSDDRRNYDDDNGHGTHEEETDTTLSNEIFSENWKLLLIIDSSSYIISYKAVLINKK